MAAHSANDGLDPSNNDRSPQDPASTADFAELISHADLPEFRSVFRAERSFRGLKTFSDLVSKFSFVGFVQNEVVFKPQTVRLQPRVPPFDMYTGKLVLQDQYGLHRKTYDVYPVGIEDRAEKIFRWAWSGDQLAMHPPFTRVRSFLEDVKALATQTRCEFLTWPILPTGEFAGAKQSVGEIASAALLALDLRQDAVGYYSVPEPSGTRGSGREQPNIVYHYLIRKDSGFDLNLSNLGSDDVALRVLGTRFQQYLNEFGPLEQFSDKEAFVSLASRLGLKVDAGSDFAYATPFEDQRERAVAVFFDQTQRLLNVKSQNI